MRLRSTLVLFAILCALSVWICSADAQTGVATGMSVTSPQGTSKTLGNWMAGWNIIYPTNTSADVTNINAALAGSQPVKLAAGTWQVCQQINVPPFKIIEGVGNISNPGSNGPQQSSGQVVVQCPTNGSFTAGQAFFSLQDSDVIRGLDIWCNFGSSPTFNNINALNAVSVEIDHNNLYWCKYGVDRFSNGSVAGHSAVFSQLAHIHDNLFYGQTDRGIRGDFSNGGFVSDEMYGPHNDFVVVANGNPAGSAIYLNGAASVQIVGDRFEDAPWGIVIDNSGEITITGNMCDQIGCMKLNNVSLSAVGNTGHAVNFGGTTDVEFLGTDNVQFSGNTWGVDGAPFYTCSSCSLGASSTINERNVALTDTTDLFADTFTKAVLLPHMGGNLGDLSNTVPQVSALSQYASNHLSSRGFQPTVSTCGTSPSVIGDDSNGIITTGSGTVTACTLTFAAAYTIAPVCTLNTSSTGSNASMASAPSTTGFTANLSATLTSGKIYYQCIEPLTNMDPVGATLASNWSATNATLTTSQGTDPLGGSTAAKITVDTNNNRHRITEQSALSGGSTGSNTMSGYFHAGSGGSLNPVLAVYDSSFFSSSVGAVFSITDGSFIGTTQQTGAGAITATGSQYMGNGWWRVWATFTLGVAPGWSEVQVAQGFNNFFTGNGTDNLLVWGVAMRPGTLP